jgi:hypothetical protein
MTIMLTTTTMVISLIGNKDSRLHALLIAYRESWTQLPFAHGEAGAMEYRHQSSAI